MGLGWHGISLEGQYFWKRSENKQVKEDYNISGKHHRSVHDLYAKGAGCDTSRFEKYEVAGVGKTVYLRLKSRHQTKQYCVRWGSFLWPKTMGVQMNIFPQGKRKYQRTISSCFSGSVDQRMEIEVKSLLGQSRGIEWNTLVPRPILIFTSGWK